jgi:hypothetical protein
MALHTNSIAGSLKLLELVPVLDPKGPPSLAPQCFRTSPKISPSSTHPRFPGVDAVRPFTGLRRTQYHLKSNACWPARKLLGLRNLGTTPTAQTSLRLHLSRRGAMDRGQAGARGP